MMKELQGEGGESKRKKRWRPAYVRVQVQAVPVEGSTSRSAHCEEANEDSYSR